MPQPPAHSRLFPDAPAHPPGGVHLANIDGASRGNPGPAAYALILKDATGKLIFQLGKTLGRQTNNVAEYYALLAALDYAVGHGIKRLRIRSDSELLVQQMKGRFKVKSPDLKPLHERASKLARQFEYFVIEHVPREMNRDADALANEALDSGSGRAAGNPSQAQAENAALSGSAAGNAEARAATKPIALRARFEHGALVPLEPLQLREGTVVLLTVRNPK